VIIDTNAAARTPPPERVREFLANQRVFISSAMGDTADERQAVAAAVEDEGARAVWFEELGRDADAEEAYLSEVDSSTIYIAILNGLYGRQHPSGFSATELEYMRAREGGKRVNVFVAADAPAREGHLNRFINERIRVFVTTENYTDAADLARRVRRRLHQLASEALAPWVKLGDFVFRAEEIVDAGETVTIRAQVNDEIAHQLQTLGGRQYGRERLRLVHGTRVVTGEVYTVRATTRAAGANELEVELTQVTAIEGGRSRAGTSGRSADDLVELGVRRLFLGEALPESLGMLGFMSDHGINVDDLGRCFDLPNEIAEPIARLVVSEGLVGSGHASRVTSFALGPRVGDQRRVALEWEEPRVYTDVAPQRRRVNGDWARP
jgi:hypothetical protein